MMCMQLASNEDDRFMVVTWSSSLIAKVVTEQPSLILGTSSKSPNDRNRMNLPSNFRVAGMDKVVDKYGMLDDSEILLITNPYKSHF